MSNGRRLVIGDVHGNYKALTQVFQRADVDVENDLLICLGDVADGYPPAKVKECFDKIIEVKNLIYILGNHDHWFRDWVNHAVEPFVWTTQGGSGTIQSYGGHPDNVPDSHKKLLNNESHAYYLSDDGKLFVHGGIDPQKPLDEQTQHEMMWDRELIEYAKKKEIGGFEHVYVGHTPTVSHGLPPEPQTFNNLTMMDTGADVGKITIMDVDTGEYWQSDHVRDLYE